tara:strand:+ start:1295 stop:2215 length:921 start_codon:yes stop_codon:yes gene_type:complete
MNNKFFPFCPGCLRYDSKKINFDNIDSVINACYNYDLSTRAFTKKILNSDEKIPDICNNNTNIYNKAPETVWLIWVSYDGKGSTKMTNNRKKCFEQIKKNCPFKINLVTDFNLQDFLIEPLHPNYKYLSGIHKFDYLFNYFSNHYGGILIAIKETFRWDIWKKYLNKLNNNNNLWCCSSILDGKGEVPWTLSSGNPDFYKQNWNKWNYCQTIGWIVKPNTPLTKYVLEQNNIILDKFDEYLKKWPALRARTGFGCCSMPREKAYMIPWGLMNKGSTIEASYIYQKFIDNSMPLSLTNRGSHLQNGM